MFGLWKVLRKKMLRKIIFLYLVLLWKIKKKNIKETDFLMFGYPKKKKKKKKKSNIIKIN